MNEGEQEEALQYATLAVQIAGKTGKKSKHDLCFTFNDGIKPAAITVLLLA